MSTKGSSYRWFKRAIERGDLPLSRQAASELPRVNLEPDPRRTRHRAAGHVDLDLAPACGGLRPCGLSGRGQGERNRQRQGATSTVLSVSGVLDLTEQRGVTRPPVALAASTAACTKRAIIGLTGTLSRGSRLRPASSLVGLNREKISCHSECR